MTRIAGPSGEAPAPELINAGFAWEIADAPILHHGLNIADIAHVLDLMARDIIPKPAAAQLLGVLLEAVETDPEDFPYHAEFGEVYNSRERHFAEMIGDSAGWLHAGRPRREAARVALRLRLRGQVVDLIEAFARLAHTTCEVAARHSRTFMPDQTYLQQAQPSTFGHYLLGSVPPALRDAERLRQALGLLNMSPGGAGCVNGSRLVDDRTRIADLLGFDDVITHTRDAMWQTDTFIDVLATCVSGIINQAKLCEDLEIWSSQEFDYVDLAGAFTRSSVLMPQKRNPYSLSIVRGASGVMIGRLSGFLAVVKSPSARSDNLIFAYGEIPRALEFAEKVTALTTGVVRTLHVNDEGMWRELENGFSQATDLAEYVMQAAKIDYRSAYLIVGEAVRQASMAGIRGRDITAEMLDEAALEVRDMSLNLDTEELRISLDPREIVESRTVLGGAAPTRVESMAKDFSAEAEVLLEVARQAGLRFEETESSLLAEATRLAR